MTSNVTVTHPYLILITFIYKMVVHIFSDCPLKFRVFLNRKITRSKMRDDT